MTGPQRATQDLILIHYGELGLKGQNRPQFRRQLQQNLRLKLKRLGLDWPVALAPSHLAVPVPPADAGQAITPILRSLQEVFGVAWLAHAHRLPRESSTASAEIDLAALQTRLLELAEQQFAPDKAFAVRVNRADKTFPLPSMELEKRLGHAIRQQTKWDKVNLTDPDVTFHLDIRCDAIFLFGEKLKGPGGLPVGSSGRVLALLSGGIDSPVAAWLVAKRGCRVDFLHFTASSISPEEAKQSKVWRLANRLTDYTLGARLFLVPYTYFDLALMRDGVDYDLVLFRRFMARVAEQLARRLRALAIVTGDNLGQVASQTLANLVSASRATPMPMLRPLLGFDKEEIVALAQKIGTYEMSIEAYKDCCALIARHPRTRSRPDRLAALEARIFPDYQKLMDQTLAEAVCLKVGSTNQPASELEREASAVANRNTAMQCATPDVETPHFSSPPT